MTIDERTAATAEITIPTSELAAMLSAMVGVAHDPARFTDAEVHELLETWNLLLTRTADLHTSVPEIFGFHQALLTEHERRCWAEHGEPGWSE